MRPHPPPPGRRALRALLLLFLAAGLPALAACGEPRPTNVLLVSIDTLRADAVGAAGGPLPTPTLDALAREGVLFRRALAPAPETAPTHATLFTGLDVLYHGVTRNGVDLPAAPETLAEAFRGAGYTTAAFVSSFVLDPRFGWARGFDHYDASFPRRGATLRKDRAYPDAFWAEEEFEGFDRRAEATTRAARRWLARAPEPFFLFVHYFDPHAPYVPPPAFARRAAAAPLDLAGRAAPGLGREALERLIRRYHGEVAYTDHWLGRLLAGLDRGSLRTRTLVVVTADHGEGLGQHGWIEHGLHLYEEQVAVPLLFYQPGRVPARGVVDAAVGIVDVPAAVADLAGLPPPRGAGVPALARAVLGAAPPPEPPLFGYRRRYPPRLGGEKLSVRTPRWKLIDASAGGEELYDLARDPRELHDRAAAEPEVAARLRALLAAHREDAPPRLHEPDLTDTERRGLQALGYLPD